MNGIGCGSGTTPPLTIENRIAGPVYGMEAWATWQARRNWRISGGFVTLRKHLRLEAGSTDPVGTDNVTLGNDPEVQRMLRSSADLGSRQQLDVLVRRVGALPEPEVSQYTALDLRYAWRMTADLELSATVQNLFDPSHAEFRTSDQPPSEIERALLLQATWSY